MRENKGEDVYKRQVISAVNCTYPKADEKEIEFVFDYEKELETCTIMQDKRWLGEAVINVLDLSLIHISLIQSRLILPTLKQVHIIITHIIAMTDF